jgi:hypothetical protein
MVPKQDWAEDFQISGEKQPGLVLDWVAASAVV